MATTKTTTTTYMSDETKCETNYSIITKWNDVNTHNYMQLSKHNKYTNDDVRART